MIVLLILATSLLLSLCACGSDASDDLTDYIEESEDIIEPVEEILTVGYSNFDYLFNPLFASNDNDKDVVRMTSIFLLNYDNDNQVIYDNSSDCVTEVSVDKSQSNDIVFSFKLREDIKTSNGTVLTVDDVLFTLYVLSDISYDGPYSVSKLPIIGMNEFRNNKTDYIEGIKRINDYSFEIHTAEYNDEIIHNLNIPILPIEYYGNKDLYDCKNHSYGFIKGNISAVKAMKIPFGAGPYAYKSYTEDKVSFVKNQYYYKGSPKIPAVEFVVVENSEFESAFSNDAIDICVSEMNITLKDIFEKIDITEFALISPITLNGYGYIGINANNVSVKEVDSKENSEVEISCSDRSKFLRTAFAVLFDAYKSKSLGATYEVINVPVPVYYNVSIDEIGYNFIENNVTEAQAIAYATESAMNCFLTAGFAMDSATGKFVSAPDGAALSYEIAIYGNGVGDHPCYPLLVNVKNALASFGIELEIVDYSDYDRYLQYINSDSCSMWVSAWDNISSETLYQLFHSNNIGKNNGSMGTNIYDINDELLDEILVSDDFDINTYYSLVYECVLDWAVEVPVYQKQRVLICNKSRITEMSFSKKYSELHSWIEEIHAVEFKQI